MSMGLFVQPTSLEIFQFHKSKVLLREFVFGIRLRMLLINHFCLKDCNDSLVYCLYLGLSSYLF